MTDGERKLAKLEQMNRDGMVAVVLNGRKASEYLGLYLATEALSCAVMSAHRARMVGLPKHLQKRAEKAHALLVKVAGEIATELTDAITRKPR
jgi:hypothetical protein